MRKRVLWIVVGAMSLFAGPAHEPKIFTSFDGPSGDPGMSYKDHPDLALAACSKCGTAGQVLVATGKDVAIYDTAGKLLKSASTLDFIRAAGLQPDRVDDPRAAYDPFIQRWIVVCSCSSDFLMVSGSQDATGTWKGKMLTGGRGDLTMFPGWDRNGVYISQFQHPLNSLVMALPNADVAWQGAGNISLEHLALFSDQPYEMRPALDPNPQKKPSDPEYLISRSGPPQRATSHPMDLLVDRITWSGNTARVSGPVSIPTGFLYNTPLPAPQPGGLDVRGNESHRVFGVSAHAGHLYLVVASGPCKSDCGAQGMDHNNLFYWFDIDAGTMHLSRKGKVSDPSLSLLFPTLATDGQGNIGIGVNGISPTQHPSVYLYTHLANDPAPAMHGPFLAHAGTEPYSCDKGARRDPNSVGWGTYSATVRDGSDPSKLWTLQEYAGNKTPCMYQMRVIGFEIEPGGKKPKSRKLK